MDKDLMQVVDGELQKLPTTLHGILGAALHCYERWQSSPDNSNNPLHRWFHDRYGDGPAVDMAASFLYYALNVNYERFLTLLPDDGRLAWDLTEGTGRVWGLLLAIMDARGGDPRELLVYLDKATSREYWKFWEGYMIPTYETEDGDWTFPDCRVDSVAWLDAMKAMVKELKRWDA